MASVAEHDAVCLVTCTLVPTGEAVQRWKGLAVDEPLLVWPSDGGHSGRLIPLG
ncbi:unnamed protein product [Penicillium camemberti]|uniref:Str. FM013 n=1 Tax=Penicillium camemberti (strain FM 013) TaxID=1429867 RepID=A0A0G4PYP7_PENC3|nr:unnamed protein product [Penicillium camemberti]